MVSAEHAAEPSSPPLVEIEFGTFRDAGWAMDITERGESKDDGTNLAKAIILETGARFAGPPPSEVFEPVPKEWLADAAVAELEYWASRPTITGEPNRVRTAILNACRARRFASEGSLCSKRQGGEWALRRPETVHPDAVGRALALQAGDPVAFPDDRAIHEIVAQALRTLTGRG